MNKTLEQLAKEKSFHNDIDVVSLPEVVRLLKQVREATLIECAKIVAEDYTIDPSCKIRNLDLNSIEL